MGRCDVKCRAHGQRGEEEEVGGGLGQAHSGEVMVVKFVRRLPSKATTKKVFYFFLLIAFKLLFVDNILEIPKIFSQIHL